MNFSIVEEFRPHVIGIRGREYYWAELGRLLVGLREHFRESNSTASGATFSCIGR
jgi:hypothetical protein